MPRHTSRRTLAGLATLLTVATAVPAAAHAQPVCGLRSLAALIADGSCILAGDVRFDGFDAFSTNFAFDAADLQIAFFTFSPVNGTPTAYAIEPFLMSNPMSLGPGTPNTRSLSLIATATALNGRQIVGDGVVLETPWSVDAVPDWAANIGVGLSQVGSGVTDARNNRETSNGTSFGYCVAGGVIVGCSPDILFTLPGPVGSLSGRLDIGTNRFANVPRTTLPPPNTSFVGGAMFVLLTPVAPRSVVPEPATVALLGTGLMALGAVARIRRRER